MKLLTGIVLLLGMSLGSACSAATFRYLTSSLPDGSTNAVYSATILTANAGGEITFSVTSGQLPAGLILNSKTGLISGLPTNVETQSFTVSANDGAVTIQLAKSIKITAAGGGGNGGVAFTTFSFPQGTVGTPYSATVTTTGGVGPYIYGAADLPTGLSFDGLTGAITGTPKGAGTFYVTLTVYDIGENNKVIETLPLLVLPANTSFQFTTIILDNGEVGSPYSDTWNTSGGFGPVTFSAEGLPPGLSLNRATGVVSGTPTVAGTFLIVLNANDTATNITMNRTLWIAPSASSQFYWDFFGIPVAIINQTYTRQPPIVVVTQNPGAGGGVTYTATGFPEGISYNSATGEISGTPTEVGLFPVKLTATSTTGEVIVLAFDFPVLSRNGGSVNDIPVNLWVSKQFVHKSGSGGKDSWKASYIYNADRRTGKAFDPSILPATTPALIVDLGAHDLTVNAGAFTTAAGKFMFKSVAGSTPTDIVLIDPHVETIAITATHDTFTDTFPNTFRNTVQLGTRGYKLDEFFHGNGVFTPTSGYRKTAFVVANAAVTAGKGPNLDSATFNMLLADPAFAYIPGSSDLEFRISFADTGIVAIDKNFTTLVTGKTAVDKTTGATLFKLKNIKDLAATNTLTKFLYDSKTGKLTLSLKNLTLVGFTGTEVQVLVELTVGTKFYTTEVTLFAPNAGSYTTTKP